MAAIADFVGLVSSLLTSVPLIIGSFFTLLEPNGTAPLQALLSMAGSEATDDPKYNHFRDELPDRKLTVDGAVASATTATVTVDASDDEAFVVPGTILINVDTGEMMRATAAPTAGHAIAVARNIGGTTHQIADGANIIIGGHADSEGGNAPTAVSFDPTTDFNYTQIFKTAVQVTGTCRTLICVLVIRNRSSLLKH